MYHKLFVDTAIVCNSLPLTLLRVSAARLQDKVRRKINILWMDTPITKRLIISGLTTSITVDDISRRLTTFGTVKATDGFGLTDGIGQPRKFAYVTLETTTGKLAKCRDSFLPC